MRIQCDVCEKSIAQVLCCADEAALCEECDSRVHAANKLAIKHQRVSFIDSTGNSPTCDICQEKSAFFFCQEDRAILCRDCDMAIHLPDTLSASHKRFLLTGIRVSLECAPINDCTSIPIQDDSNIHYHKNISNLNGLSNLQQSSLLANPLHSNHNNTMQKSSASTSRLTPNFTLSPPTSNHGLSPFSSDDRPNLNVTGDESTSRNDIFPNSMSAECNALWKVDELLNIPELADGYSLADIGSSKAESANLGEFDWTADLSLFDEQIYAESLHEVPQMPSPNTAYTSSRSRSTQASSKAIRAYQDSSAYQDFDDAFVPDVTIETPVNKRKRQL